MSIVSTLLRVSLVLKSQKFKKKKTTKTETPVSDLQAYTCKAKKLERKQKQHKKSTIIHR